MKKLYKFYWDYYGDGEVEGIFVADEELIEKNLGKTVSLGEILGKYSDVFGDLDKNDLTIVTDNQDFIKKFEELKCESGYNPLRYISEEEE